MSDTIHGYSNGDRIRDCGDGTGGTVRFLDLTDEERATGEYAEAEIVWDGLGVRDELATHVLPHLERV